ncbi:hypothetical protein NL533_34125, partial [Klebsiella pneumoniae]|nr:hypothetical protein [Klebsiella pneumoniae]
YKILSDTIQLVDDLVHEGIPEALISATSMLTAHFESVLDEAYRLSIGEQFPLSSTEGLPEETLFNPFNKYLIKPYTFKTTFD